MTKEITEERLEEGLTEWKEIRTFSYFPRETLNDFNRLHLRAIISDVERPEGIYTCIAHSLRNSNISIHRMNRYNTYFGKTEVFNVLGEFETGGSYIIEVRARKKLSLSAKEKDDEMPNLRSLIRIVDELVR